MDPRFVTKSMHAFLDYPVALSLIAAPFLLGLGASNPLAFWLALVTGGAALLLTVLTDHHLGVFRVLPYSFHLAVDLIVGIAFVLAPSLLGFSGIDAWYYWLNGAAVLTVVSLHKPEANAAAPVARG
ncbi:MAG: hypothetical protein AAGF14_05310 [Pseudomonadota bacterium]